MGAGATARVVIVTDAGDDDALIDMLTAGLADLMAKRQGGRTQHGARTVTPPPPRVLELVHDARPSPARSGITDRQADVLRLVARGQSNKEIARDLGVSPATVKTHVAQLIAILGAANRTDAAIKAGARGLL